MCKTSDKNLIYILNSYSKNESSHFYHVINLISVLAESNVNVVLLIEKAADRPEFRQKNIIVDTLHRKGLVRYLELFLLLLSYHKKGYKNTFIRISSVTAIVASFAAIFSGARTFFWQSGTTHEWDWAQPFGFKKLRWFLKSYIPGFVARKMTTYFVTGPEYMVDYYESIVGVKKEKIKLLYNDIDIERFSCSTTEKRIAKTDFLNSLSLPADTKILLIVHRLSPVRRTGFYFRQLLLRFKGAAEASKTIIVIAGGGCELEELKKISAEYELENKCVFMGEVPNNKIQSLYKVADLFLHPTFNEGFPRVILEAMASGLPIVSTNAGGSEQLVGPKQKMFVVDKNDPVMFTNKVVELLNDCRLQQSLAYENLEYVRRFSTENVVLMYKKVLFDEK